MKTLMRFLTLSIFIVCLLFPRGKTIAQITPNGAVPVPPPTHDLLQSQQAIFTIYGGYYSAPNIIRYPLIGMGVNTETPNYMLDILCTDSTGTHKDVNISCINCTPVNSVGYRIDSNYVIWTSGDISSLYAGVGAGFGNTNTVSSTNYFNTAVGYQADRSFNGAGGVKNSAFGSQALFSNTTGFENCAFGYLSLTNNVTGTKNLAIGTQSLQVNTIGGADVAVGHSAEYENITGSDNVGVGHDALYTNRSSGFNVAVGERALFNDTAESNTATGYNSGSNIFSGVYNTADGFDALEGITGCTGGLNDASGAYSLNQLYSGNFNASQGAYSLYNDSTGSNNSALGYHSGYTLKIDNNDLFLGNGADELGSGINSASAIGSGAITTASNYMVLGNNNVRATIGLSGRPVANPTRLEINTQFGAFPFNVTATSAPPAYINGGVGKGWSGLRFDDLTTRSGATRNPGPGVLGLDTAGNVIYVLDTLTSPAANIGTCSVPNVISATGGAFDLATNNTNFSFLGNLSGSLNEEDVIIGDINCLSPPIPAKLNVFQASGVSNTSTQPSIALYVENDDLGLSTSTTTSPVIGIQSIVPNPNAFCFSVAGWFEADGPTGAACSSNYAILVPHNGGFTGLNTSMPIAQLQVDGEIFDSGYTKISDDDYSRTALIVNNTSTTTPYNYGIMSNAQNSAVRNVGVYAKASGTGSSHNIGVYANGNSVTTTDWAAVFVGTCFQTGTFSTVAPYIYSDSTIKTKVDSFSNAISLIKKLKPKTFYYDTINQYNLQVDTFMHYGFIAQEVQRAVPCLVRNVVTPEQIDTGGNVIVPSSTINAVDYNQFAAILTAAFQEQQQISYHDSVVQQLTIDSLRNAFKNIQNCLSTLCFTGDAPVRGRGGNGNSGDSNSTITNTLDVTLSASTNAPLLYQNIPNPFSTGTKINYYLPEGTIGATMVFYDTYGNQIKTVQLSQTGNGTLNITPDNLTGGIYSYSLVVNNNIIDTKRMILQK